MLAALGLDGSALIVIDGANPSARARGAQPADASRCCAPRALTSYDILRYQHLVLTREAVEALRERVARMKHVLRDHHARR